MIYLIPAISYLLGTIPSALIIVRFVSGVDIRTKGSGNIGAMNSYDITKKKWVGIAVTLMDAAKGVLAVLAAKLLAGNSFFAETLAATFVVLGHNFNLFLKFKGGRGLASAMGAFFIINPYIIILWALMWLAGYFIIRKQVHVGNVTATIGTPLLVYYTPDKILNYFMFFSLVTKQEILMAAAFVGVLILLRHIKPMILLFRGNSQKK